MIIDAKAAQRIAQQLEDSEQSRAQISQISQQYPGMTVADSYAVQKAWVDLKLQEGQKIWGHKVGLTSRAMQLSSNVDEPDCGVRCDYMFYEGGATLPFARFVVPRVEVQGAFMLQSRSRGWKLRCTGGSTCDD